MVYTFNLKSKVILITGGYGHLGKAITESLLFHGADVYVLGRNQQKFLDNLQNDSNSERLIHFQYCDIADPVSISKAFKVVYEKTKRIDVLINNAYYNRGASPESMTDEEWLNGIDGTLNSVFRCMQEVIPYFKNNKRGKIINVSSMYGIVAPDFEIYKDYPEYLNPVNYGAAKAGIIQLSKYYASFYGKLGITINTISPGPFPSENVQRDKGFIDELNKKTCLNRIGKPEDLAGAFVFLASDTSDFITGQNIIVDGGWTTR
jgi:NAD(P)-dependent dehydrogenase (short-subunit alcohol dehydrogenase family)